MAMRTLLAATFAVSCLLVACSGSEAADTTTVATTAAVSCDPVSADVQAIGEGLDITGWVQVSIAETMGGYNSIVQARGPGGNFTWAVDQDGGQITGLVASLDALTEAASSFPYNEPGTGGGNALATEQVLATPAAEQIGTCDVR